MRVRGRELPGRAPCPPRARARWPGRRRRAAPRQPPRWCRRSGRARRARPARAAALAVARTPRRGRRSRRLRAAARSGKTKTQPCCARHPARDPDGHARLALRWRPSVPPSGTAQQTRFPSCVRLRAVLGVHTRCAREGGPLAPGTAAWQMSSPPPPAAAPPDPARELEEAAAELRKLGYHYNEHDELRSVDGEREFKFVNQARHDLLAPSCSVSGLGDAAHTRQLHWLAVIARLCSRRGAAHLACLAAVLTLECRRERCSSVLPLRVVVRSTGALRAPGAWRRGLRAGAAADAVRPEAAACSRRRLLRVSRRRHRARSAGALFTTLVLCRTGAVWLLCCTRVLRADACSIGALTACLLAQKVLLCGAGAVAAGHWARRLCINESLTTGSVMPYVGA